MSWTASRQPLSVVDSTADPQSMKRRRIQAARQFESNVLGPQAATKTNSPTRKHVQRPPTTQPRNYLRNTVQGPLLSRTTDLNATAPPGRLNTASGRPAPAARNMTHRQMLSLQYDTIDRRLRGDAAAFSTNNVLTASATGAMVKQSDGTTAAPNSVRPRILSPHQHTYYQQHTTTTTTTTTTIAGSSIPGRGIGVTAYRNYSSASTRSISARRMLIPPPTQRRKAPLTVVLDLDETLVYARNGPVHKRPHCDLLLDVLRRLNCEVIVWTAAIPTYAARVLRALDPTGTFYDHLITRSTNWFNDYAVCTKDLGRLGRDLDRMLFVENSPSSVRLHPRNSILLQDYNTINDRDLSLKDVCTIVEELVTNPDDSVPVVLSKHALLRSQRCEVESRPMTTQTLVCQVPGTIGRVYGGVLYAD